MRDDLVTVGSFHNAAEAYLLHDRLEAEGVWCHVFDPHPASGPGFSGAAGGVLVQVMPDDAEKARQIVADFEATAEFTYPEGEGPESGV